MQSPFAKTDLSCLPVPEVQSLSPGSRLGSPPCQSEQLDLRRSLAWRFREGLGKKPRKRLVQPGSVGRSQFASPRALLLQRWILASRVAAVDISRAVGGGLRLRHGTERVAMVHQPDDSARIALHHHWGEMGIRYGTYFLNRQFPAGIFDGLASSQHKRYRDQYRNPSRDQRRDHCRPVVSKQLAEPQLPRL